jgi:hypothetical protein
LIKQLEDKLKLKEKDLESEARKVKTLEDELSRVRKSGINKENSNNPTSKHNENTKSDISANAESTLKKSHAKELELLSLIGRRERVSHLDLCKRIKDDATGLLKGWIQEIPASLKDCISNLSQDALVRVVPYYALLSEEYTQHLI